jgi:cell division protein FtsB
MDILFLPEDLLVAVVVVEEISLQAEEVEAELVELILLLFLLVFQFHLILLPALVLQEDHIMAGLVDLVVDLEAGVMHLEEEELEQELSMKKDVVIMVLVVQGRVE